MPSPDHRRSLALLMGAAAVLGLAVSPAAVAQEPPAGPLGEDLFGSYALEARGQGVQTRYEIEGLLPGGTPVLDFGLPEALARFSSGPTGYGVASLAYPGGLIVNLPSLVEQSGGGGDTPPYPIKEEAFFPTGPTEAGGTQPGGAAQRVLTGERGVEVLATFPAIDAPPAVKIGSISTAVRSSIEEGKAVSRTRVVASDIAVLGGVLTIESVVTDLVAVHDGNGGTTAGGTTASGVKFLGLDAALTGEGLVLQEAPPVEGPGAPLGGILTPIIPPAGEALSPLQKALNDVLDQANPQLDELLAMAGIRVSVAAPEDVASDTGAASRVSSGVLVELSYKGREQAALGDLIATIPDELKPNVGPIPNPVGFLAENHITAIALAPASVSSLATPPFPDIEIPPFDSFVPGPIDPGTPSLGDPGFVTPTPGIDTPSGGDPEAGGDLPTEEASAALGGALPALLVALALLASPFFGLGSSRLADNMLADVSTSCPTGLDKPPPGSLT